jgi:multidrug efflux pump subunit AcrA (membrane-fusion protein)
MEAQTFGLKRRRRRWAPAVLVVLLLGGGAALAIAQRGGGSSSQKPPPTEAVSRGEVVSTVSGIGTLQPASALTLAFSGSGTVTAVPVEAGQRVQAGEVLARLDDRLPRAALGAARAQVGAAAARLSQLLEGASAPERHLAARSTGQAAVEAANARQAVGGARSAARAELVSLRSGLTQAALDHRIASGRLTGDRTSVAALDAKVAAAEREVAAARGAIAQARARIVALAPQREAEKLKEERDMLEREERERAEKAMPEGAAPPLPPLPPPPVATGLVQAEAQAQSQLEEGQGALEATQAALSKLETERESARLALPGLRDAQRTASEALRMARTALRVGTAGTSQTIALAAQSAKLAAATRRATAASGAVTTQPARRGDLAAAAATVSLAESELSSARQALEETVLRAPAGGRVASVKLGVGDVVLGGVGSRAAPSPTSAGTTAEPAAASTSGSTEGAPGSSAGAEAAGATTGGGAPPTQAIVLDSPKLRLFSVPLTEADAVKVHPGDPAKLRLNSSGRTVAGSLASLAPLPQVRNGVVTYSAIVASSAMPAGMRVGMTAEVSLVAARRRGVASLPRTALPGTVGAVPVEVLRGGHPVEAIARLGLAGEERVQVLGGLHLGERVILPGGGEEGYEPEEEEGEGAP